MMNISKLNKAMNLIIILLVVYAIITTIKQQAKINSYEKDISYYTSQVESLKEKQEDLEATQKNVNSEQYIEEVAREKLDMYYPNETVYIDISK